MRARVPYGTLEKPHELKNVYPMYNNTTKIHGPRVHHSFYFKRGDLSERERDNSRLTGSTYRISHSYVSTHNLEYNGTSLSSIDSV